MYPRMTAPCFVNPKGQTKRTRARKGFSLIMKALMSDMKRSGIRPGHTLTTTVKFWRSALREAEDIVRDDSSVIGSYPSWMWNNMAPITCRTSEYETQLKSDEDSMKTISNNEVISKDEKSPTARVKQMYCRQEIARLPEELNSLVIEDIEREDRKTDTNSSRLSSTHRMKV